MLGDYVQVFQSIYELKQAACVWHLLLEKFVKSISFIPLFLDPSILINGKVIVSKLILMVYIDNLLIAGEYEKDIV